MRSATGIPSPRAPPAAPGPGERWHAAGPHALGRGDARAAEAKQAAAGRCSTPRPRVPASGDRAEEPEHPPPPPGQARCSKHRPEAPGGRRSSQRRGQAPLGNASRRSANSGKSWARGNLKGRALGRAAPQDVPPAPFSYRPPPLNAGSEEQKPAGTPGSFSGGGGAFGGARVSYPAPSSSLALNHRICMKIHIGRWFCSARKAKLLF